MPHLHEPKGLLHVVHGLRTPANKAKSNTYPTSHKTAHCNTKHDDDNNKNNNNSSSSSSSSTTATNTSPLNKRPLNIPICVLASQHRGCKLSLLWLYLSLRSRASLAMEWCGGAEGFRHCHPSVVLDCGSYRGPSHMLAGCSLRAVDVRINRGPKLLASHMPQPKN